MKKKSILITQDVLSNFAGSEIVTLELANDAISRGFDVTICTNYFGMPISEKFDPAVRVIGPDEAIDMDEFTHIWIHHNLIPSELIKSLRARPSARVKVAFHHMSPYVPIESPLLFEIESLIATNIYFNSPETMDAYKLLFDKKSNAELSVLGNPAPDSFVRDGHTASERCELRRVLVVSNHPPRELIEALEDLKRDGSLSGYEVFGSSGKPTLVTPEILNQYDLVISIGKTVQYCLVGQRLVYVYDHFGGPGYMNQDNFEVNRYYNFSGRGFDRMSRSELASDIVNGFSNGYSSMLGLSSKYGDKFTVSTALDDYFAANAKVKLTDSIDTKNQLERAANLIALLVSSSRAINHLKGENANLSAQNHLLVGQNEAVSSKLKSLEGLVERSYVARFKKLIKKIVKNII